jgi:hypothetical protein
MLDEFKAWLTCIAPTLLPLPSHLTKSRKTLSRQNPSATSLSITIERRSNRQFGYCTTAAIVGNEHWQL